MIDLNSIALRLKEARIKNGMTQETAGSVAGLSIRTIRRCEKQGTTNLSTLDKLCDAYAVNITDIICGSNDLIRLAEIIKRLGPNACKVLESLCRSIHGGNLDS
jgi:DNA-binding XRE family transcriptional regulator